MDDNNLGPRNGLITLHRDELYEKVWTIPMTTLCKAYGLSDNGLRKICKKMSIPTPPAGYWAQIQHGQKIPHRALPFAGLNTLCEYKLYINIPKYNKPELPTVSDELSKRELLDVKISDNLRDPHYLIKLHKIAKQSKEYGSSEKMLAMSVSQNSEHRALLILNNIFNALEMRRISVFKRQSREGGIVDIKYEGCVITLNMAEKMNRQPIADPKPWKKHEWVYNGKLEIQLSPNLGPGIKTLFSENDKHRIEELISEIVSNIFWGYPYIKEQKVLEAERWKKEQELLREKEEKEERIREEQRKYEVLKKLSENYSEYKNILNFIDYIRQRFAEELRTNQDLRQWLEWAENINEDHNKIRGIEFLRNFEKPKSHWGY